MDRRREMEKWRTLGLHLFRTDRCVGAEIVIVGGGQD